MMGLMMRNFSRSHIPDTIALALDPILLLATNVLSSCSTARTNGSSYGLPYNARRTVLEGIDGR